jgi:hypothetical protein
MDMKSIAKELHKPARKVYPTRKVIVYDIDDIWSCDLVDMIKYSKENEGYKYILNIIDCFSKYAWSIPLKTKDSKVVLDAFKKVCSESGRKPLKIWCDQGSEFVNKYFKKWMHENNITMYHTYSNGKAVIVERFNRTMKTWMWTLFTENDDHKWIDLLKDLIKRYNNTFHHTIKMTPTQASKDKNYNKVYENTFQNFPPENKSKPKFNVGDYVRISLVKNKFEKGYTHNWSKEIFEIVEVKNTVPYTYRIQDSNNEILEGSFYEPELQKTKAKDVYVIEKILKKRTRKGIKEVLVKWKDYDNEYNSWIKESDLN